MIDGLSDMHQRFHIGEGTEGGVFVIDGDNEFPSEFVPGLASAIVLRDHRNGKHLTAREKCRACVETPGMILPLPHDPAAGFNDPNLSLSTVA